MAEYKFIIFLFIEIVLCISAILKKNSRFIYFIAITYCWFIIAFSMDSYDISNYRYCYDNKILLMKEPIVDNIFMFCSIIGIPFNTFKFIWGTIICILLSCGFKRISSQHALLVSLFAIYPVWGFTTQMRSSMAGALFIFSLPFLFQQKNKKVFAYIAFVLLASMFHKMAISYLIFLIPFIKIKSKYYNIIIVSLLFFLMPIVVYTCNYITLNYDSLAYIALDSSSILARFLSYFESGRRSNITGFVFACTHHLFMFMCLYLTLKKNLKVNYKNNNCEIDLISRINFTSLLFMPFYCISSHFLRIYNYFLPFSYGMTFAYYVKAKKKSRINYLNYIPVAMFLSSLFVYVVYVRHEFGETLRIVEGINFPW